MKETYQKIDPIIINEIFVAEQKIVKKKIGTIKKPKNKLFEYNVDTGRFAEVVYEKSDVVKLDANGKQVKSNDKLVINPNCVYINALNMKSAYYKLITKKIFFQTITEKPKDIKSSE